MKRLAKALLIVPLSVMAAAFLLQFVPGGQDFLDRVERAARMGMHRMFWSWPAPIPTTPRLERLHERLDKKGLRLGAPVFVRIFKKEARLELWLQKGGRFELFSSYPICYFSGRLGPKQKRGDRQAPEGFYTVSKGQLNPHSRWHRAFNLGYPNLFDRSHRRTGDFLMVHGGCSSIGCYAMTNRVIDEIWTIIKAALNHGQRRFQVQALPFRMNEANMRRHRRNRWISFWRDLREGYEMFERTHVPPLISVCRGRYVVREGRPGFDGSAPLRNGCLREA